MRHRGVDVKGGDFMWGLLQGFAPHFDDIDAFVLQVEGAKRY
jgi:ribosomal protein L16 Arg81 hydroxylase